MHPYRLEHSCPVTLGTRTGLDIAALCHIMHPYRLEHSCTVTLGTHTGLGVAALCHIMHPYRFYIAAVFAPEMCTSRKHGGVCLEC